MAVTTKISVAMGDDELRFARKLAKAEGCSLSSVITRFVRAQMAEHEQLTAAREYLATFSKKERGSPVEHAAFFARIEAPPPAPRRSKTATGRRRAA